MIYGVTGFFCSGKDTMAEVLESKGFAHISLSDMIREELRERGMEIAIPNLTEVGNELRREHGPGVLGERALARIDASRDWVITSIRHPAEVEALRKDSDFVMVFVDAPRRLRFERSLGRAREGDPDTLEEFAAQEERQMSARGGDPAAQALAACREMADERIENDSTLERFKEKIELLVSRGRGAWA
jgi:dephospho-CoA kinase